jgi:hypothetical protein
MTHKKSLSLTLLSCIVFGFFACETSPDIFDGRLPKYSEIGRNVAGCIIDDETVWLSQESIAFFGFSAPIAYVYTFIDADSLLIKLDGSLVETGNNRDIEILLKNISVNNLEDLLKLEGQEFELDGISHSASLELESETIESTGDNGKLYIRNVALNADSTFVISGTFGFDAFSNIENEMKQVQFGRFDYTIESLEFIE